MSPDNIGSAVNRFSGWPSNDPLKTDNESNDITRGCAGNKDDCRHP